MNLLMIFLKKINLDSWTLFPISIKAFIIMRMSVIHESFINETYLSNPRLYLLLHSNMNAVYQNLIYSIK